MDMNSDSKQKGFYINKWRHLKVPLLFSLLVIILNQLSLLMARMGYLFFFEKFNAKVVTGLIQFFNLEASRNNNIIHLTNAVWKVDSECTAITIMIIFASFVVVYKTAIRNKVIGLLIGLPFIFGANMMRLLTMAFIDKYKPVYSAYFHDYIWQVAFIIMVVFMWIIWTEKVANRERKTAAAA